MESGDWRCEILVMHLDGLPEVGATFDNKEMYESTVPFVVEFSTRGFADASPPLLCMMDPYTDRISDIIRCRER